MKKEKQLFLLEIAYDFIQRVYTYLSHTATKEDGKVKDCIEILNGIYRLIDKINKEK